MRPCNRRKTNEELTHELEEVQAEAVEIKKQTPKIEQLRRELHRHLEENSLGERLYLQMVQHRR